MKKSIAKDDDVGCFCFSPILNALLQALGKPDDDDDDGRKQREEFEQTVMFLASVPLFQNQLPRSELPRVAQNLTRLEWSSGQELVRQGDTGRALFLIQSGEVLVVSSPSPDEPPKTRAKLCRGDYFGGHTLMTERPNIATMIANGPVVTLSMSRTAFNDTGLRHWLTFPKRPAIYDDASEAAPAGASPTTQRSPEEIAFIVAALQRNVNLRAFLQTDTSQLQNLAAEAKRREVPKGTVISHKGDTSEELFIIRSGTIEVNPELEVLVTCHASGNQQSAEEVVASSTMAERLLRKQNFLKSLSQKPRAASFSVALSTHGFARAYSVFDRCFSCNDDESDLFGREASDPQTLSCMQELTVDSRLVKPRLSRKQGNKSTSTSKQLRFKKTLAKDSDETDSDGGRSSSSPGSTTAGSEQLLAEGDSFGELSMLYSMHREATFRAYEDSVLYVISRQNFTACFRKRNPRFEEYCKLLDELPALSSLLSSERWELACNAIGVFEFRPGERIIAQGTKRDALQGMWYVIISGSGILKQDVDSNRACFEETRNFGEIARPGCFGERALLRDVIAEISLDAGDQGLTCLAFNGETIRVVLERVLSHCTNLFPDVNLPVEEWCKQKVLSSGINILSRKDDKDGKASGDVVHGALKDLTKICPLGRGGYAEVSLVKDMSHRKYALKSVSKGLIQRNGAERLIRWERELLQLVDSPFIIKLIRTYKDEEYVHFLMEAALGGSLMELLHKYPDIFNEDKPRGFNGAFYVACILAALEHMHERCIVHRDIKPENALLDERGIAKVCDMGFARFVLGKTNTLAGTPDYMAPEMIDFPHTHDKSVDWWALGVLTYELLAGQPPFEDEGFADNMARLLAIRRSQEQALSGKLRYPFHFPYAARSFVNDLLRVPSQRLGARGGASELRSHAMFSSLKFDFEAFHAQLMPPPISRDWFPDVGKADNFGTDWGVLSFREGDSLFVPFDKSKCFSWVDDF